MGIPTKKQKYKNEEQVRMKFNLFGLTIYNAGKTAINDGQQDFHH